MAPEEVADFEKWVSSPNNAAALRSITNFYGGAISSEGSTNGIHQAIFRVLHPDHEESHRPAKHTAIAHEYFKHLKKKYLWPKIGLFLVALGGAAGWMFWQDARPLKLTLVAFGCFVLLMVRQVVIGFRIKKGYFGGTESEVREFVKFIVARRGEIDFTDQGGKRRPSLVPEPTQCNAATSATSVPTGALSE